MSWNEKSTTKLLAHADVRLVTADQCQYGLAAPSKDGERLPGLKPTRFMTNASPLANMIQSGATVLTYTNRWKVVGVRMRLSTRWGSSEQ